MIPLSNNTQNDSFHIYDENFIIQSIDQTPLNIPTTNPALTHNNLSSEFGIQDYNLSNLQNLLDRASFYIPDRTQDSVQENSENDQNSLDRQESQDKKFHLVLPNSLRKIP